MTTAIKVVQDGGLFVDRSVAEVRAFVDDPFFIHYIGMINPPRPGVGDCAQQLEQTDFPPGTERNNLFHMHIIEWEELMFIMVSIPISDKHLMERMMQVHHLRAANGIPIMFGGPEIVAFPIEGERVFTMENTRDHPVYSMGLQGWHQS